MSPQPYRASFPFTAYPPAVYDGYLSDCVSYPTIRGGRSHLSSGKSRPMRTAGNSTAPRAHPSDVAQRGHLHKLCCRSYQRNACDCARTWLFRRQRPQQGAGSPPPKRQDANADKRRCRGNVRFAVEICGAKEGTKAAAIDNAVDVFAGHTSIPAPSVPTLRKRLGNAEPVETESATKKAVRHYRGQVA